MLIQSLVNRNSLSAQQPARMADTAWGRASQSGPVGFGRRQASGLDTGAVLASVGQAAYDWDIPTDRLSYGYNTLEMLGITDPAAVLSGKAYARHIATDSPTSRHDAIFGSTEKDQGSGVAYQACYAFIADPGQNGPGSRASRVWIEDRGRWFANANGQPARAHGIMRVLTDRAENGTVPEEEVRQPETISGVLNRNQLMDHAARMFQQAEVNQAQPEIANFAVLLAGIENLASLNTTYGYDIADMVIEGVAMRLRDHMRANDVLARYSGNKFALVLEACDGDQMGVAAQRFLDAVSETPIETPKAQVPVRLRIGAVVAPRHARTPELLMQHAEEVLDSVRAPSAQRYAAYQPSLVRNDSRRNAVNIADEIISALNSRRVMLALQPIVSAASGKTIFYEALMRIRREDGTIDDPSRFFPTVEKAGLVQLVDQRMLELAMAYLVKHPNSVLSVNAAGESVHDPDFPTRLKAACMVNRDAASRLIIEITETCAIENLEATQRIIAEMKAIGVKVAIDDFGAGHTSFRNLRGMSLDLIKIDGAFMRDLPNSPDDRFFVQTLVQLAQQLRIPTVAEWIEDAETARLVTAMGVDYLQGHYYGRAEIVTMPGERTMGPLPGRQV